jgi:hypothetical protein
MLAVSRGIAGRATAERAVTSQKTRFGGVDTGVFIVKPSADLHRS